MLLPAQVVNEYCHPTRSFEPTPNFTQPEATGAWRSRATDEGEWFSTKYCSVTLGEGFAIYRGAASRAVRTQLHAGGETAGAEYDSTVVAALLKTRQAQRTAVVAQYSSQEKPARDDSVLAVPLIHQYSQQSLNSRRPSINSRYQYEDNDIQAILASRLQQLRAQNQQLIKSIEVLAAVDNIAGLQLENRLRQEAERNKGARTLLIPCNLGNAHWTGILLAFSADGQILRAEYIDSLKSAASISVIPGTFKKQLQAVYPKARFEIRTLLQQSDYTSCGAYTVENLLTAALNIQSSNEGESIRHLHLEALKQYNPDFYSTFNERQQNNRPTTARLQEQLGYLDRLKGIWFSKSELNRILAIKQCLFRLPEEIEALLLQAFKPNSAHPDEHDLHLNIIRIALQEALKFESKALTELMELLFENWQAEDSLALDKLNFCVSYNEILAVTESHLLPDQLSDLQKTLVEQIEQDEKFALALQAELWGCSEVSFHLPNYAEQCQSNAANEQADTGSVTWIEPLTYLRRSNANSSSQNPVVPTEEKQPRVLRERPRPVFRANTGDGL